MLTLIMGKPKSGKTTKLFEAVRNSSAQGISSRIVITPEQITHLTERKLVAFCGNQISLNAEVLSFSRLENRLASLYGGVAITSLDTAGRLLATRLAMNSLNDSGLLKVFAGTAQNPEFLHQLLSAIDVLKTNAITPNVLRELAEKTDGFLSIKLEELSLILSAYQAAVAQGSVDSRDKLNHLREQLINYDYAAERDFFVDGFSDFTAQEFHILEALLQKGRNLTVTILCDSLDSKSELFADGRQTAVALINAARKAGTETQIITAKWNREERNQLNFLAEHLITPQVPTYEGEGNQVMIVRAESILDECRNCAAFLKKHAIEGIRYRDMFVALGKTQQYIEGLTAVCEELGIPVNRVRKRNLLEYPCVSHLMLALDVAVRSMNTDDVLAYLRSGYSGATAEEIDIIDNYVLLWNVRGAEWTKNWERHPDGFASVWDDASQARLEELNRIRMQVISPLVSLREQLKSAANVRSQVEALYHFVINTGLYEQLTEQLQEEELLEHVEYAQELSQVWAKLMEALQQIVSIAGSTSESPECFARILKLALKNYEISTIPPTLDSVTIGTVSDVRGYEPELLCILGASDEDIPGTGTVESVLTDSEINRLNAEFEIHVGTTAEQRINRNLLQLYCALYAPKTWLYLSFASKVDNTSVKPSFLITRAETMFSESDTSYGMENLKYGYTARKLAWDFLASNAQPTIALVEQYPIIQKLYDSMKEQTVERRLILSQQFSQKLFGNPVGLTASKLDDLNKCPLSFFLNYGIHAKKLEEATFDAAEFGTFIHRMLELTVADMKEIGFDQVNSEMIAEALTDHMHAYEENRPMLGYLSNRARYVFDRHYLEALEILKEAAEELAVSDFSPAEYELQFGRNGMPALPVSGTKANGAITGTVDRLDIWNDGVHNYYRIIDYKSSGKELNYAALFHGIELQIFVYLFQLDLKKVIPDSVSSIPAGAIYYPAMDKIETVNNQDGEHKTARRSGFVLNDDHVLNAMENDGKDTYLPINRSSRGSRTCALTDEQMETLKDFVQRKLAESIDRIAEGRFFPEPFYNGENGKNNGCTYCNYKDICQKDTGYENGFYSPKLSSAEFWEAIEEGRHGKV